MTLASYSSADADFWDTLLVLSLEGDEDDGEATAPPADADEPIAALA